MRKTTTIGIDLAKNVIHVHGINQAGKERVHPFVVLLEHRLEGMGDEGGLGPPREIAQIEVLHHRVFNQHNRILTDRCPAPIYWPCIIMLIQFP